MKSRKLRAMRLVLTYTFCGAASLHSSLSMAGGGIETKEEINGGYRMICTRLYADSSGESHFEDIQIELKAADFAPPAPPLFITEFAPAVQYGIISAPPGWYGDWHPTPKRQMMFYLQGEVEAEASDGEVRRIGPGSITLVEDTSGKGHRSRVVGDTDVVIVVVELEN